jgi:hypothetical protein
MHRLVQPKKLELMGRGGQFTYGPVRLIVSAAAAADADLL